MKSVIKMASERLDHEAAQTDVGEVSDSKESLSFSGLLHLTRDPETFLRQMSSREDSFEGLEIEYLDDISTDHIIRVPDLLTDDVKLLGDRALLGLAPEYEITTGSLRAVGKEVLVAGERFGRGSGREQAVWALKESGIRAVIAPSFGPIFERNAAYLSLFTSTNLNLIRDIARGKAIPLDDFAKEKDPLMQQIVMSGGLFNYLRRVNTGKLPPPEIKRKKDANKGMNIIEQRLAKAFEVEQVKPGDASLLPIDAAYSYVGLSGLARQALISEHGLSESPVHDSTKLAEEGLERKEVFLLDPEKIFLFEDHFAHSQRAEIIELTGNQRLFAEELGIPKENYYLGRRAEGGGAGITHRVMLEKLDPRSSQIVVATDSHTPTIGALPIAALPVGSTLFAAAIAEGKIPYSVSPTLRVDFSGSLPAGVTVRDAQLELAATVEPVQQGLVIEYGGEGLNTLTFEQVAALCNMVPEVFNAEVAVTEAFEAGMNYLQEKFEISEEEALNLYGMPEKNCQYAQVVQFNLSKTVPRIALPGRETPHNAISLASLAEHPKIDKAFLVSCTLGIQDLKEGAAVILDKQVAETTQLIIVPSSDYVRKQAEGLGLTEIFNQSGASVVNESACGPCIGEGLGAVERGEIAITASNRNFPGRMGARTAPVYMGGAILTTLAAVYGRIPTVVEYKSEIPRVVENLKKWQ